MKGGAIVCFVSRAWLRRGAVKRRGQEDWLPGARGQSENPLGWDTLLAVGAAAGKGRLGSQVRVGGGVCCVFGRQAKGTAVFLSRARCRIVCKHSAL